MSDYGKLAETVEYMVEFSVTKATRAPVDLLVRGALAGALLGLELLTGNFGIMPPGRFTRWEGGTIPW